MTLPDERYRSLVQTKKFLMELQSPHMMPKIPKAVRQRANSLLKHWPDDYHLSLSARHCQIHLPKRSNHYTVWLKDTSGVKNESGSFIF